MSIAGSVRTLKPTREMRSSSNSRSKSPQKRPENTILSQNLHQEQQIEDMGSGFRMIKPNAAKNAKLHEIARKEEELWENFREKNRIKSLHEVHRLGHDTATGPIQTNDNVNKAREQYFRQKLPTKYERQEKQKQKHLEWKLKEDQEIEEKRRRQREKAELNEAKELRRQMEMKEEIEKNRSKFLSQYSSNNTGTNTNNNKATARLTNIDMNNNVQKKENDKEIVINKQKQQQQQNKNSQIESNEQIRIARENYFNKILPS